LQRGFIDQKISAHGNACAGFVLGGFDLTAFNAAAIHLVVPDLVTAAPAEPLVRSAPGMPACG
jgi:hypothetical protein